MRHVKTRQILWTFYLLEVHFKEILLENNFFVRKSLFWSEIISNKLCLKIHRLKCTLPSHILKILYNSLILPHCTYGILSWGANVDKVLKLQKKAVRIITKSAYNSHSDPLFKTLWLLKIHDIYKCNVLKFFYQHCHGQLPFFLQNIDFKPRSDIHEYNTRQKTNLCTNKTRTSSAQTSIRNITPKIINKTSSTILDKIYTHNLQGFVSYIKNTYI